VCVVNGTRHLLVGEEGKAVLKIVVIDRFVAEIEVQALDRVGIRSLPWHPLGIGPTQPDVECRQPLLTVEDGDHVSRLGEPHW
jgi:hypothetical protein